MKLELILSKEETNKWSETGEDADRWRTTIRSIIRQCLDGTLSEIEIVNNARDEILETIRRSKVLTSKVVR